MRQGFDHGAKVGTLGRGYRDSWGILVCGIVYHINFDPQNMVLYTTYVVHTIFFLDFDNDSYA